MSVIAAYKFYVKKRTFDLCLGTSCFRQVSRVEIKEPLKYIALKAIFTVNVNNNF